jgi:formylglycine-generating enzyme required for sulfatase activity
MVRIPGGSFLMGSPEGEGYSFEEPQHEVARRGVLDGAVPHYPGPV